MFITCQVHFFIVCREWKWMKQNICHIWAHLNMKTQKVRVLHPFNFHLFNTPWQYFPCHRSFSMKWYEWMKASVLRYELSICQMCSGRQVLVSIKLTIYTTSFAKMPQSHGKGMSPFFMDSFYAGFSVLQEHREVFQFAKHLSLPALACR